MVFFERSHNSHTNIGTLGTNGLALPTVLLQPMQTSADHINLVTKATTDAQAALDQLLKTQGSVTIQVNGVNARPGAQGQ